MPINATRKDFFIRLPRMPVNPSFVHEPAASRPAAVVYPSTLTAPEKIEVDAWRKQNNPSTKATLYAALSAPAKAKADEFIAFDKAFNAWKIADDLARENQWHWMAVDSAIMTYDTVPKSGSTTATGSGAPAHPVVKQEPV